MNILWQTAYTVVNQFIVDSFASVVHLIINIQKKEELHQRNNLGWGQQKQLLGEG